MKPGRRQCSWLLRKWKTHQMNIIVIFIYENLRLKAVLRIVENASQKQIDCNNFKIRWWEGVEVGDNVCWVDSWRNEQWSWGLVVEQLQAKKEIPIWNFDLHLGSGFKKGGAEGRGTSTPAEAVRYCRMDAPRKKFSNFNTFVICVTKNCTEMFICVNKKKSQGFK